MRFSFVIGLSLASVVIAADPYKTPEGLVRGGAFMDLILPIPVTDGLERDCWGGDNVKPRVVKNGIEDPQWSYWCASGMIGPDGKEHLFTVRWPQNKSHKYWVHSQLVHAVADKPTGPFTVIEEIGPGHNAEIYQTKDGTYVVSVTGKDYRSKNINGPWEPVKPRFDVTEPSMSNKTFARREDGSFLMITRAGTVWLSEDGLKPWRRLSPKSVYPYTGALEDPVLWRDEVQYHLIVNNWPKRMAHYGRSKDGLHWTWDPGTAYDNTAVRHPDGTIEGWYKIERPKVRQDKFGRATHMYFAVIDCPKEKCDGTNSSSSKAVVVPLVVGRRLAILAMDDKTIRVEIKAEDGFDPQNDVDVRSLRFGAPHAVNFGKGSKPLRSESSGKNLIVTFDATGHGLTTDDFVAKLIGRNTRGELLFGYARLPVHAVFEPLLVARLPSFSSDKMSVVFENVGLVKSTAASVKIVIRSQGLDKKKPGKELQHLTGTVPPLEPYATVSLELPFTSSAIPSGTYDVDVLISADIFTFRGIVVP